MKTIFLSTLIASCALAAPLSSLLAEPAVASSIELHTATQPVSRLHFGWWKARHQQKLEAAKTAECDVLFIGDSITHMWESHSGGLWKEKYVTRKAFNIGYSGDQTQHVLWRLDNGELANFQPKVAVLMIGTNNTGHQKGWSAQKVADGIESIIQRVHAHSPKTKVLLLGIFPRGASPQHPLRVKNDQINALISKFDNGNTVHFLDISSSLLEKDGTLSKKLMPDLLHPNARGYKLWHDAMEPKLRKLLGE